MDLKKKILEDIKDCDKLLIGIGEEWNQDRLSEGNMIYEKLCKLVEGLDYFIVTTVTDGLIRTSSLDQRRITAPCGNETWRQCSLACTKDIWEPGEVPEETCPHCGAPLVGNTIESEVYIEEGYMPQWNLYTKWLSETLNKKLTILELGVGFKTPTVIRWPFEKTAAVNKKAHLYRVHESFAQLTEDIRERADSIKENSVEFFLTL